MNPKLEGSTWQIPLFSKSPPVRWGGFNSKVLKRVNRVALSHEVGTGSVWRAEYSIAETGDFSRRTDSFLSKAGCQISYCLHWLSEQGRQTEGHPDRFLKCPCQELPWLSESQECI